MRCHICDANLSKPDYNAEIQGYEPCDACLAVIQDTLDGYLDQAYAPEDAFGGSEIPQFLPIPDTLSDEDLW